MTARLPNTAAVRWAGRTIGRPSDREDRVTARRPEGAALPGGRWGSGEDNCSPSTIFFSRTRFGGELPHRRRRVPVSWAAGSVAAGRGQQDAAASGARVLCAGLRTAGPSGPTRGVRDVSALDRRASSYQDDSHQVGGEQAVVYYARRRRELDR